MTRRTYSLILITFSSAFFAFACSSTKSPSDVVKVVYKAANDGKYSEVEKHLSGKMLNAINGKLGPYANGVKGLFDGETRNRTVENIDIEREEVRGNGAAVYFATRYKDGTTLNNQVALLVKEHNDWKMTIASP
jgi:hypothetical protein